MFGIFEELLKTGNRIADALEKQNEIAMNLGAVMGDAPTLVEVTPGEDNGDFESAEHAQKNGAPMNMKAVVRTGAPAGSMAALDEPAPRAQARDVGKITETAKTLDSLDLETLQNMIKAEGLDIKPKTRKATLVKGLEALRNGTQLPGNFTASVNPADPIKTDVPPSGNAMPAKELSRDVALRIIRAAGGTTTVGEIVAQGASLYNQRDMEGVLQILIAEKTVINDEGGIIRIPVEAVEAPAPDMFAAEAPVGPAPTQSDVVNAGRLFQEVHGRPATEALFKKFALAKFSDLAPEKYAEFVAACQAGV